MNGKSKYTWRTILGLAAYALGLAAMNHFDREHLPHRYWLVLLPVLPIVFLTVTIHRQLSERDEMWRKIITGSLAFSAIATAWTCFSYLFLRDMGAPEFHAEWVLYIMVAYYGIGALFSWRRYR
jgi:hypothetical protein